MEKIVNRPNSKTTAAVQLNKARAEALEEAARFFKDNNTVVYKILLEFSKKAAVGLPLIETTFDLY